MKEETLGRKSLFSIVTGHKSTPIWPVKQVKDYLRYALWLSLIGTAMANQRKFGLATTWLPHLLGNSIALLLPEIYGALNHWFCLEEWLEAERYPTGAPLWSACGQLVEHNADYLDYVAPAALAYIVSHPRFNIYRGEWGKLTLLGFGLDTLPHVATAYALSNLSYDTIAALEQHAPAQTPLRPYIEWLADHKTLASGLCLASLTFVYELGEYFTHKAELRARNYDLNQINMMWSPRNTVFDVISNIAGWAFSVWRHR